MIESTLHIPVRQSLLILFAGLVLAGCQGTPSQSYDSSLNACDKTFQLTVEDQVAILGYPEDVSKQFLQWVTTWKDSLGRPLIPRWQASLLATQVGDPASRKQIISEQQISKQLAYALRRFIKYDLRWFELNDTITHRRGQCLAYTQAYVIVSRALGLRVTPINVIETDSDTPLPSGQGHVACLVTLSDNTVMQIDITPGGIISKPFKLHEVYESQRSHLCKPDSSPLKVFKRIQLLNTDGLVAHLLNSRGTRQAAEAHYAQALPFYTKAIALDKHLAEAYNNRAVAYLQQKKFDDAMKDCEQALMLHPVFAEALNTRGVLLVQRGQLQRALADFDNALQIKPAFAKANRNRNTVKETQHKTIVQTKNTDT